MHSLVDTLDLLQRHHSGNRSVGHRATPHSAEWHSLWGRLRDIREAAAAGDVESRDWLAIHGSMIANVEACRAHDLRDAMTVTPGRR